jgi:hypothetical protein
MLKHVLAALALSLSPAALAAGAKGQKSAEAAPKAAKTPGKGKSEKGAKDTAPPVAPIDPAAVESVLSHYHTRQFLADVLPLVEKALSERSEWTDLPGVHVTLIQILVKSNFKVAPIYELFKTSYAKTIDAKTLEELQAWFDSPTGRKLPAAYDALYSADDGAIADFYGKKSGNPVFAVQSEAAATLATASAMDRMLAAKRLGADLAVQTAINSLPEKTQKESFSAMKGRVQIQRAAYLKAAKDHERAAAFMLMRGFSADEVKDLVRFASSATGKAAAEAYLKALEETVDQAAEGLANDVGRKAN